MTRRVWIIAEGEEITQAVLNAASAANCPEIARGIPPRFAGIVNPASLPTAYQEPESPESPMTAFTHWARVNSFNVRSEKPLRVKREWQGVDRLVECYVTEAIKNLYLAGGLAVNDLVIIEFIDGDINKPLAFAKVFKSW